MECIKRVECTKCSREAMIAPFTTSSSTPLNQTTPCPTIQGLGLDLFLEIRGLGKVTTAPVDLCLFDDQIAIKMQTAPQFEENINFARE